MRAPSRVPGLSTIAVLVATATAGCGGSDDPPERAAGTGVASAPDPRLRGLQARRERAPRVLAAVERAIGEDDVIDLTFERDRFTVLTGWVTREERDSPANSREAEAEVRDPAEIQVVCRTVLEVDPGADVFVAGYDGTSWRVGCPQNEDGRPPR